jgi:hypothetical protein
MSHLLRLGNGGTPKGRWSIEREDDSPSFSAGRRSNKTLRREEGVQMTDVGPCNSGIFVSKWIG